MKQIREHNNHSKVISKSIFSQNIGISGSRNVYHNFIIIMIKNTKSEVRMWSGRVNNNKADILVYIS